MMKSTPFASGIAATGQDDTTAEGGRDLVWLAAILVFAAVLRVVSLNSPLWFDEIITVDTHLRMGWGEMLQSYSMNHHYLHNLAAKATMEAFGDAPWAIRLPALAFGLAAIAVMWFLARDLAGAMPAHATALLLALSYHHIWFSQNARGYTGLAFFSTFGLLLFLRGLKSQRHGIWMGFGVVMAATIFTHLTGAFFFVTLGLVWLAIISTRAANGTLDRPAVTRPLLGFVIGSVLTILLYLPVLPSLLSTVSGVAETSVGDVMQEYQNPLWTADEAIRTGVGQAGPLVSLIGVAILGLSALGAVALRKSAPLFAPVTFGHILLTVAILLAVGMRIWPRFFFTDIAFLMFLIVMGVRLTCDLLARLTGPRLGAVLFPLALAGIVLVSAAMASRNYMAPKQDLAGAFAFVEANRQPGERVFTIAYAGEIFTRHFHADWATVFTNDEYRAAMAIPGPVTVVVVFPDRSFRSLPSLAADRDTALTEERFFPGTLGDGGIFVLHRD